MKTVVITLALLTATAAFAQPLPVPKQGGPCPSSYRDSGSYCTPTSDRAPRAIPKVGPCPSGWADNGHFCTESAAAALTKACAHKSRLFGNRWLPQDV
jgi:hypothetical protein